MIATADAVFAGTNVDDLTVLTVLFLARVCPVYLGHGRSSPGPPCIAVLVVVSALAALGLRSCPAGGRARSACCRLG
jgi:hypothetical protein